MACGAPRFNALSTAWQKAAPGSPTVALLTALAATGRFAAAFGFAAARFGFATARFAGATTDRFDGEGFFAAMPMVMARKTQPLNPPATRH
jgi:hypothetical protein